MYFIRRGCVDMVSEDGQVTFAQLKEGQYFGEISLFFDRPRTVSIRAATNCDLFALSKADLCHAMAYYPHIKDQIREVAEKRAELAKVRSLIASQAAVKGLSPAHAAQEAAKLTQDEDSEGAVVYRPETSPRSPKYYRKYRREKKGIKCNGPYILYPFGALE